VFVTLCALPLGWIGVKKQQGRRQREAAAAIEKLRGQVEWSEPSGPVWLRNILGDDYFRHITAVDLMFTEAADADLLHLEGLNQLESLSLSSNTTDAGLEHLRG
jgi:hypothetical protein